MCNIAFRSLAWTVNSCGNAIAVLMIVLALGACVSPPSAPLEMPAAPPSVIASLAATGALRVAFLGNNPVQAQRDPRTGAYHGVAIDLAQELSARLRVPLKLVPMINVTAVLATADQDEWDVAFLAHDPARADRVRFTTPYLEGHNSVLVPERSTLTSLSQLDRAGVRIALQTRDAIDLHLSRIYRNATLIRSESAQAFEALKDGRADAYAANVERLETLAASNPGYRLLPGSLLPVRQSVALPATLPAMQGKQAQDAAHAWLEAFVSEVKRSGLVEQGIRRSGLRGVNVAP
jgi:polar amino acid transport system substrate-binding protein